MAPAPSKSHRIRPGETWLKSAITTASARTGENPREEDKYGPALGRKDDDELLVQEEVWDFHPRSSVVRSPSSRNSFTFRRTNFTILFPPQPPSLSLSPPSSTAIRSNRFVIMPQSFPSSLLPGSAKCSEYTFLPPAHSQNCFSISSRPRQPDPQQHPPWFVESGREISDHMDQDINGSPCVRLRHNQSAL